jgi:hypothetical protein
MSHGSPFWQGILIFAALAFLAWEMWRGWRAGVIRSGISLAAIVVSALVAYLAGSLVASLFGGFRNVPGLAAGILVGGVLGTFVFVLIWFLGAVLFKRTEHQSSGLIRLLWGAGGALLGLALGLVVVWSGISVIRAMGALAGARVDSARKKAVAESPQQPVKPPKVATALVTLKQSLELGSAGKFVEAVDPLPSDFYELIAQIGKLSADQETMMRFLQYPGMREIMESPPMVELVNDPAVIRAAESRDVFSLMGNKALLAAVRDPALSGQLRKIDLRAAMKFALEPPAPPPSPSPKPPVKKKK